MNAASRTICGRPETVAMLSSPTNLCEALSEFIDDDLIVTRLSLVNKAWNKRSDEIVNWMMGHTPNRLQTSLQSSLFEGRTLPSQVRAALAGVCSLCNQPYNGTEFDNEFGTYTHTSCLQTYLHVYGTRVSSFDKKFIVCCVPTHYMMFQGRMCRVGVLERTDIVPPVATVRFFKQGSRDVWADRHDRMLRRKHVSVYIGMQDIWDEIHGRMSHLDSIEFRAMSNHILRNYCFHPYTQDSIQDRFRRLCIEPGAMDKPLTPLDRHEYCTKQLHAVGSREKWDCIISEDPRYFKFIMLCGTVYPGSNMFDLDPWRRCIEEFPNCKEFCTRYSAKGRLKYLQYQFPEVNRVSMHLFKIDVFKRYIEQGRGPTTATSSNIPTAVQVINDIRSTLQWLDQLSILPSNLPFNETEALSFVSRHKPANYIREEQADRTATQNAAKELLSLLRPTLLKLRDTGPIRCPDLIVGAINGILLRHGFTATGKRTNNTKKRRRPSSP